MPNSSKRRRVPLACSSCRERKVRCDGTRPVCGSCRRRGVSAEEPCEYLVIAETAKYQSERAYIQTLRDHISLLESSVAAPLPLESSPNDHVNGSTPLELPNEPAVAPIVSAVQQGAGRHEAHCEHYPSPATPSVPSSISAMGAAVADVGEADLQDQYFGRSSLVSLVQESTHAFPRRPQPHPARTGATWSTPSPASCNLSCTSVSSSLLSDDYSLPPRKTTDWLLDVYFTSTHLFYPWVHKDSFLISYHSIWSNEQAPALADLPDVGLGGRNCPTSVFYCALNAMLAMACEFSSMPPHEKRTTSLMFSERMKSLMNIDIFDSGSLAHVQALLLVAMYLQCTSYPKRCWNIVGMAYRTSVGLGLHRGPLEAGDMSRLERAMRWRAWCGCVHMDMVLSMTMGRPAMTPPPYDVPLPSPVDDEYLAMGEDIDQPSNVLSGNQFLFENTRLIRILGKILSTIYHSSEVTVQPETLSTPSLDLQAVLAIDAALDEFQASLHPALHWAFDKERADNADVTCKRLSNVLHARFLHLRLLLYRPAFSDYCSRATKHMEPSNGVAQQWSSLGRANCAVGCVQAACDLVESLARATVQDATGAWWYGVFYLISAGIILLLADSSGAPFERPSHADRQSAWDLCIHTLHRMSDVHPSARDYAIVLSGLKQNRQKSMMRPLSPETGRQSDRTGDDEEIHWASDAPLNHHHHHHHPSRLSDPGELSALDGVLDPFLAHWDNGVGDIMLPAQLLREIDDGLLLPSLF